MSRLGRITIIITTFCSLLAMQLPAAPQNPHMERAVVPAGCAACHVGHGDSQSPMLAKPQRDICLGCHDAPISAGGSLAGTRSGGFRRPFRHPLSESAYSSRERGAVVCTSCHSPHRGMPPNRSDSFPTGRKYVSPKNPDRFEYELCYDCHGSGGTAGFGLSDLSSDFNAAGRSFHPVEAPARETAESVIPELSGREINCTDCHGNSQPGGLRGPHGSDYRYILKKAYTTTDGAAEAAGAYALCYVCHRRETVLQGDLFPYHRSHVVDDKASCATCHDAHGAPRNRALIRFGGTELQLGIGPSASGRMEFRSEARGEGACFLTCHGVNHDPEVYGAVPLLKAPVGRRLLSGRGRLDRR